MNVNLFTKKTADQAGHRLKKDQTDANEKGSFFEQLLSMIEVPAEDDLKKSITKNDKEIKLQEKSVEKKSQLENNLTEIASGSFIIKEKNELTPVVFSEKEGKVLVNGNSYNFNFDNETNKFDKLRSLINTEFGFDEKSKIKEDFKIPSDLKSKNLPENAILFKQGDQFTLIDPEDFKKMLNKNSKLKKIDLLNQNNEIKTINIDDGGKEIGNFAKTQRLKDQIELLENFGHSKIKVSVENHPKQKILRESTNNLISEHKKFLETIKQRSGIKFDSEVESKTNNKENAILQSIKEQDKNYFSNLVTEIDQKSGEKSIGSALLANKIDGGEKNSSANNNLSPKVELGNILNKINQSIGNNNDFSDSNLANGGFDKADKLFFQEKEATNYQRVRATELINETVSKVRLAAPNGAKTARMLLNPESLGKVIVKIEVNDNVAKLNIKAENADAVKLIEKQIGSLIEKLKFSGIQTEDVNIEQQKLESDSSSKEGSRGRKQHEENKARKEFLETFRKFSFSSAKNE